jgi:hypothetical protein
MYSHPVAFIQVEGVPVAVAAVKTVRFGIKRLPHAGTFDSPEIPAPCRGFDYPAIKLG